MAFRIYGPGIPNPKNMIEILPETEEKTLVVKATGTLTGKDYEEVFIPELNRRIENYGRIKVLMYLTESFTGWELSAAWDDAVFGLKHRYDFEKIAVVSDQKWVKWAAKIGGYFMEGQVATYALSEFKDALNWLKREL